LVSAQLLKYLYPNPSVGRPNPAAGVFPYLAFLGVLTHFPQGIAPECYELFVSRIAREQDVAQVVEHIRRYLRLTPDQRQELVGALSRIPIISEGQIVMHARRSSLLRTIGLNRSYMLSFLTTPGLVQESGESLRLKPDAFAEAEAMVRQHLRHNCYIAFASAEDWVAFYGAPQRHPTYAEALAYYRTRGDVARGVQTFRQAQAGGHLPPDLSDLSETGFRKLQVLEKTLEDFLEFNLDVIEKGLIFVARQYRTSTGPLDILARDAAKRWVIIELKRGRAADRVVGQLLRYRGFIVRERGGGNPRAVRCLAIAPDPDARLVEAAIGADPAVEVFEFTVTGRAKRLFPKA
jgi:hypothetical protein